jgi:hypothetical protein
MLIREKELRRFRECQEDENGYSQEYLEIVESAITL